MSVCLTGTKIFLDSDETLHGGGVLLHEQREKVSLGNSKTEARFASGSLGYADDQWKSVIS